MKLKYAFNITLVFLSIRTYAFASSEIEADKPACDIVKKSVSHCTAPNVAPEFTTVSLLKCENIFEGRSLLKRSYTVGGPGSTTPTLSHTVTEAIDDRTMSKHSSDCFTLSSPKTPTSTISLMHHENAENRSLLKRSYTVGGPGIGGITECPHLIATEKSTNSAIVLRPLQNLNMPHDISSKLTHNNAQQFPSCKKVKSVRFSTQDTHIPITDTFNKIDEVCSPPSPTPPSYCENSCLNTQAIDTQSETSIVLPLQYALRHKNYETIKQLLEKAQKENIDLNQPLEENRTFLMKAVLSNDITILKMISDYPNINPEVYTLKDYNILMFAAETGNTEIINLLFKTFPVMKESRHINAQNKNNQTAYAIAIEHNYPLAAQLLTQSP